MGNFLLSERRFLLGDMSKNRQICRSREYKHLCALAFEVKENFMKILSAFVLIIGNKK